MATPKRFKNRRQAGEFLAKRLAAHHRQPGAIVLALPRGGVPVGFAVANALDLPLDLLLVRKLGVPGQEELAMGAIASGGRCILQSTLLDRLAIPMTMVEAIAQRELHEIERRETLYRGDRPDPSLQDRTVILVDDGAATGSTMMIAINVMRSAQASSVVVAIPVAAPATCKELGQFADETICLNTPDPFYALSMWYDDFAQTTDEEVKQLLDAAERAHALRNNSLGTPP